MKDIKMLTSEAVILDPVFLGFDVGISKTGTTPTIDDISNTQLTIIQKGTSKRDSSSIKNDVYNIFKNYFDRTNCNLGQIIDLDYLNNSILSVDGVESFYTQRTDDTTVKYEGLNMLMWNPIYSTDIKFISQNMILQSFQFPFLNDRDNFLNKIKVQTTFVQYEQIEY
jgi:hypothetical protein